MKTRFEIRNPESDGIFLGFDTEHEAMRYWREEIENASASDMRHGAVVVRHEWETEAEAETARLDFLISPGSIAKFSAACLTLPPGSYAIADEWPKHARTAIDIARGKPESTSAIIWPHQFP
jgi:sarcosine oxidase gamma subunit